MVAKKIIKLLNSSKESTGKIDEILSYIKNSINIISDDIMKFNSSFEEQSAEIEEKTATINELSITEKNLKNYLIKYKFSYFYI